MTSEEKCGKTTSRFNCGCCDEVVFQCDKRAGHGGYLHRDRDWYEQSHSPKWFSSVKYPVIYWDERDKPDHDR